LNLVGHAADHSLTGIERFAEQDLAKAGAARRGRLVLEGETNGFPNAEAVVALISARPNIR